MHLGRGGRGGGGGEGTEFLGIYCFDSSAAFRYLVLEISLYCVLRNEQDAEELDIPEDGSVVHIHNNPAAPPPSPSNYRPFINMLCLRFF